MNYKSLYEYVKFNDDEGLYDLVTPTFLYDPTISLKEYEVTEYTEMRIDLIFKEMYNLEDNEVWNFLDKSDVVLYLNNIDNPMNIKRGMTLIYPAKLEYLEGYRMKSSAVNDNLLDSRDKLLVHNKSTKKDPDREKFKKYNYVLPPVVLETPKTPVKIDGDKFIVGGL